MDNASQIVSKSTCSQSTILEMEYAPTLDTCAKMETTLMAVLKHMVDYQVTKILSIEYNIGTLLTINSPIEILTTPSLSSSIPMHHLPFAVPYKIATLSNPKMPDYGGVRSYYNCMTQNTSDT